MAKRDYYEILGVSRDASDQDLKNAYRKLAMKYHPDRNPGDEEAEQTFKEIQEAYDVLKDSEKRRAYDRFGHSAFEGAGGMGGGDAGAAGFGSFADIFEEMFGDVFGGRRGGGGGQRTATRGADLRYNMTISLEQAFHGEKTQITVPTAVGCESCNGTGSEGGAEPTSCGTCGGRGAVRQQQGFFMIERPCPNCGGAGRVIKDPCKNCGGQGRVEREKQLDVTIPAGVEDGQRIRLAGEGEAGLRGGPPGDLYIFLNIKPHPLFEREGPNIHCRVPINMVDAAMGSQIEVPTIDGNRAKVNIPEGTQTGQQFRLKNKGMSILRSSARGDMYITAFVETPVNLNRKQKDLLRQFKEVSEGDDQHHPHSEGFLGRVKEFFEGLKHH